MLRLKEELLRRVNVAAAPYKVRDVLLKQMIVQSGDGSVGESWGVSPWFVICGANGESDRDKQYKTLFFVKLFCRSAAASVFAALHPGYETGFSLDWRICSAPSPPNGQKFFGSRGRRWRSAFFQERTNLASLRGFPGE